MKIIKARYSICTDIDSEKILKAIELYGRTAYKSENKITKDSSEKFIAMIIVKGHLSVLEHISLSVRFICDRGISHEIVRHRIASYTQESTRYCNYSKDKFDNQITFIEPCYWNKDGIKYRMWKMAMQQAELDYFELIKQGAKPQEARSVLPNSLKTEIIVTMNLREWIHFFKLRTSKDAHPQMREITIPLLQELKARIPIIFDAVYY